MQQLTGMEGMFLSVDAAPSTNAVLGGLMIYAPSDDPNAGSVEQVVQRIEERLDAIPPFRWTLTGVPVGINNAYWVETDIDVSDHVREITLPSPGDHRALGDTVAGLIAEPMDKSRPMWDFIVIRGLADGSLAHLLRVHHAVMDGGTVPEVLDLLSDNPTVAADPKDARPGRAARIPAPVEIVARGLANTALSPVRLLSIQAKTVQYLLGRSRKEGVVALPAYLARMLPGKLSTPLVKLVNGHQRIIGGQRVQPLVPHIKPPESPFNGRLTERRQYAFSELPLDAMKKVGKARGMTLNDVVVTVCAGATRRYLLQHGLPCDEPLIVCIPSSIRTGDENERWANHVSMFFAEFPTDVSDPLERLHAVHEDIKVAKANFDALPTHMFRDVSKFMPLTFWNTSVKLLDKGPDWFPGATWNVVVSNVRGPANPMYFGGATMIGYWPAAFLTPGVGLNITLQSYQDRVDFGFMGCPDLTPDLWDMAGYMEASLQELIDATAAADGSSAPLKTAAASPADVAVGESAGGVVNGADASGTTTKRAARKAGVTKTASVAKKVAVTRAAQKSPAAKAPGARRPRTVKVASAVTAQAGTTADSAPSALAVPDAPAPAGDDQAQN